VLFRSGEKIERATNDVTIVTEKVGL